MGQVYHDFQGCYEQFLTEGKLTELGVVPLCIPPGASCVEHSHEGVEEVMIVKSGRGQFEIEDQWFEVCEGSLALVRSGEFHAIHNTGDESLEVVAIVNANVDLDSVRVKSRAEHFASKAAQNDPRRADLTELRKELGSVSRLLDEVRDELDSLRNSVKAKRSGTRTRAA